jgi:hypothetical protein
LSVLVEKGTFHDEIRGEISDACTTVDLLEIEFGKKEFSRLKSDTRRNSKENERKILLERRASQDKESVRNKRSTAQLRRDLEKQIHHDQSLQDQPLNTEMLYFSTFTDHHCAVGTQRLFIKGASKDSNVPQRFMPVTTAFDMDGVQLYDYCQRNDLLRNPEISIIFELEIPAKRTVGEEPSALADSESDPFAHGSRTDAARGKLHETTKMVPGSDRREIATLSRTRPYDLHGNTHKNMPESGTYTDDFVANETKPTPGNMFGVSLDLLREKRRNTGHSDPELDNCFPEKKSGNRGTQTHGKYMYPPEGDGTTERGNSETKSRGSAYVHARADYKSERLSYANKPHAKSYKMSKVTQIVLEISVSALQPSTKMLLKAKRRTPMAITLVLRMTLQVKKGRLN